MSDDSINKPGWKLADIAKFAGKTASGVANWRIRFENFPKPIGRDGVAMVFDPVEVQKWLEENKHLIDMKPSMDTAAARNEKEISKALWNSLDIIRGIVPTYQTFYFFYDALAHGFDIDVKSEESSPWTEFISDNPIASSKLYENWFKFFSTDSASRNTTFSHLLQLLPELAGFKEQGSEHLTPKPLAQTMAKIVDATVGQLVVDPCVGIGTLLLETALEGLGKLNLYGREINTSTARTARAVFALNGLDVLIEEGDSVRGGSLPIADRVVAAPPLSQRMQLTPMERKDFRWDYVDPGSEGGDLAWAQLVLGAMNESGIGAMLTSHGLLFRSGKSETFRQRLIGRGHLEAVITLPAGMLYGTSIPSAILVFNKAQKPEVLNAGVLLADVLLTKPFSKSHGEKKFPIDLPSAIASLVLANRNGLKINEGKYKDFELRCIKIKSQVLAENEFNLLPIRYFKSSMQDQNMGEIRKKIAEVESRIEELNKQLAKRRSPGSDERLMR
jgi:hypothetical protein